MKASNKQKASLPENNTENQGVDKSRRSFAKVGVTLAPLMMTLANRSAWGRDVDLCTQSGFTSFNLQASQTAVYNKRAFNSPPPSFTTGYSGLTPEQKAAAWQTWATSNGFSGAPFDSWTVSDWETFATNCYDTGTPSP